MEDKIPYIVHEGEVARLERTIKKLVIVVVIAIIGVIISNAMWLHAWLQYDYSSSEEEYSYEQDGNGINVIGEDNKVDNGTKADNKAKN